MAWTAPMTAIANSAFTAAQFNLHVRDNLNETAPAKATTAGRLFVSTGPNSIAEREIRDATVATSQTTTSTSFTDLATAGPEAASVTTGVRAVVWLTAHLINNTVTAACVMGYAVSGATTTAANDSDSLAFEFPTANLAIRASWIGFATLTAGVNTFTAKYRVTAGTGTFIGRRLAVIAL